MTERRHCLIVLAAAACGVALPAWGQAPAYPTKLVRLVVPYSAGGIADVMGRLIAQPLGQIYGKPVIVENKPGAGGHLGGAEVAKGPADGHTLMLGTIAHNGVMAMYPNLTYDPAKDLQPVILVAESAGVLVVNPSFPARSVSDFIAQAKAQPGKIAYGSAGNGSAIHMAAALFEYMADVKLSHVPYKGSGPVLNDLIGGQIPVMFDNIASALPHIKGGKLRPLGVTSPQRHPSLPDVPTIAESGVPGYASVPWYTISVARGVPSEIVHKLNADLNTVIRAPELKERWEAIGVTPLGGSVDDAVKRNAQETRALDQGDQGCQHRGRMRGLTRMRRMTMNRILSLLARATAATVFAFTSLGALAQAPTWTTAAPFPQGAEEVYGIASGGKFHVFGGLAPGWKPMGMVLDYDPASNAWIRKKDMPAYQHHVALAELNGKIYVFGGFRLPDSGPATWIPMNTAWEYDTKTDSWRARWRRYRGRVARRTPRW
jgi:tripartite-type tricarboxylate transporter receptor subunit TctC